MHVLNNNIFLYYPPSPKKSVIRISKVNYGTKKAARRGSLSINLYLGAIRTPTQLRGEHPRRTTYSQP